MSEHKATIIWSRGGKDFGYKSYSRDHLWRFELAGRDQHDEAAHPHFVCSSCGDVKCLPEEAVDVKPLRGVPRSLRSKKVEIQIRGVCNSCD